MRQSCRRFCWIMIFLFGLGVLSPAWGYLPYGPVPEKLKGPETKLWTDEEVDAVVEVSYMTIDGLEPVSPYGAPAACDQVNFLRFKARDADDDAAAADACLLMVPGVLEGANGFHFIGRQLVYIAKKEYGKHIEVWAMDRRANCLEDLAGLEAAERAATAEAAADIMIGYYYNQEPIGGRTFAGFLASDELPFLYHFGMRQATLDMFAIIEHMVPDAEVRKQKVFVGGHSLGGLHTSVFLSWDLDANPATTEDAGYNWTAGAFGFDTTISPLSSTTAEDVAGMTDLPGDSMFLPPTSEEGFQENLSRIQSGRLARNVFIQGIFGPEVIALPEAMAILAAKDPDGESHVLKEIPKSPELDGVLKLLHSRTLLNMFYPPFIEDFRYTNQALVGLVFDDQYSNLSFLQAGIGFLHGGPVVKKWSGIYALARTGLGSMLGQFIGTQPHYIAADAGPGLSRLGEGPLYGWARRDQIGTLDDPNFTSKYGCVKFTDLENEPCDIRDLIRALYVGPTNLTEWYFPMRILIESSAVSADYATRYGLDVYHADGVLQVPSLLIEGGQGMSGYQVGDPPAFPQQQLIVAPGFTHMDPMFEAVNSPSQPDYVMRPLIDFVLANLH